MSETYHVASRGESRGWLESQGLAGVPAVDGRSSRPIPDLIDILVLATIGGETVVDFALRLKRELAGQAAVWVVGYSNDVMGYIPSKRVHEEGGDKAETAMRYSSTHPSPWAPSPEERIVSKVHNLIRPLHSVAGGARSIRRSGLSSRTRTSCSTPPRDASMSRKAIFGCATIRPSTEWALGASRSKDRPGRGALDPTGAIDFTRADSSGSRHRVATPTHACQDRRWSQADTPPRLPRRRGDAVE